MNRGVVSIGLKQHVLVFDHAHVWVGLRVVAQLVVNIHLDRVEWAELGAIAAVHANRRINEEILRLWHRAFGNWVFGALDPDALGWADLGANAAAGAFDLVLSRVLYQERDIPKILRHRQALFWIFDRHHAVVFRVLPAQWACHFFDPGLIHCIEHILGIRIHKMLQRHAHALQDSTSK